MRLTLTTSATRRNRCQACGRSNTLLAELEDVDSGRTGWTCWRRACRALATEMIESGASHIRLRNLATGREVREADRQARELGERDMSTKAGKP